MYIPNQAIRAAKLCFLLFFLLKIAHECGSHVTLIKFDFNLEL